jgi:HK97 gp10 family phage protein
VTAPIFDGAAFRVSVRALHAALRRAANQGLKDAVEAAAKSARDTSLFNDVTGALRKSITERVGDLEGDVSANTKYARYVECGTDPHEITPRRKQALRFVQNGRVVFASRVMHPGTKARPFMGTAADVGQQVLDYGVDYYVGEAVASFNVSGS